MPGELILFAGPICTVLNVPASLQASYIALYIGFQFGLSDSFRTALNVTDNCLSSVALSRTAAYRSLVTTPVTETVTPIIRVGVA